MRKSEYVSGQFSWVDLQTTDVKAAQAFYSKMFGWDARVLPTDVGIDYVNFLCNGLPAAGLGPMPPDQAKAGVPPHWSSYVNVIDAAATVEKAASLGGKVLMPAMQVMDQGVLAMVADPTGAVFGLWQPKAHKGAEWVNGPGGFCWNELYTNDVERARSFYGALFGWTFSAGESGAGTYWQIANDGQPNGGMLEIQTSWGPMPPHWAVYFTVDSLEQADVRAKELGATQTMPPTEVPGTGRFIGLRDPQGASFLVIQLARRS